MNHVKTNYFKVTITFPLEIFEDGFTDSVRSKFVDSFSRVTECLFHEEHGDGGNFHIEGVMSHSAKLASDVKKFICSSLGVTQSRFSQFNDVIKRRFVVIKKAYYLDGCLNYVIKEGGPVVLRRGWEPTWIAEAAVRGAAKRVKKQRTKFLTDCDARVIMDYCDENDVDLQAYNLINLRIKMTRDGFSWMKIRKVKALMAEVLLLYRDDESLIREVHERDMI